MASLACLCEVPIGVVDRLLSSDRLDPILILCKSVGWGWPTVKAIIDAMPGGRTASATELDAAFVNFERLSPTTSQAVIEVSGRSSIGSTRARMRAISQCGARNPRFVIDITAAGNEARYVRGERRADARTATRKEVPMRLLPAVTIILATLVLSSVGANAAASVRALREPHGGTNCGFHSFEQCQAAISGNGGFCSRG